KLAIAAQAGPQVLPGFDESRRIGDHEIEPHAGAREGLQLREHLAASERAALAGAVERRRLRRERKRGLRSVDAGDIGGARHRRLDREAGDEAVEGEGARGARELRHEFAVVALVVEPAGLLAAERIDLEAGAVLAQLDRAREGARGHPNLLGEPFEGARGTVVP